jgi:hypothetical protein
VTAPAGAVRLSSSSTSLPPNRTDSP